MSFSLPFTNKRKKQVSSFCEEKEDCSQSSNEERCNQLKNNLRSLLDFHEGSTKQQGVIDTIQSLSELSPFDEHSPEWLELFVGEFMAQTSPNFPGRLPPKEDGDRRVQYTLGRLSFNTFHPNDVVCTLRGVRNVVRPKPDGTFSYDVICDTIIHLPGGDVEAEISNESYCCKDDDSSRVHVFFTGSKLSPAGVTLKDKAKMALWSSTFNEATLKAAAAKKSYMGWMMDQALKRMLGMNVRLDDSNSFRLEFKKPFRGHIDVLYLDEDIRITRGNRGTLVVMERISKVGTDFM